MKNRAKLRISLLCILILTMLLPSRVFAAGEVRLDESASLTIVSKVDGKNLAGVTYDIYPVAERTSTGAYDPLEAFSELPVDLSDLTSENLPKLAKTLEIYCDMLNLAPMKSGVTDEKGNLSFDKLDAGLYLIRSHRLEKDDYSYTSLPSLVFLPGYSEKEGEWIYDVTVNSKMSGVPVSPDDEKVNRKVLKVWEDDGHEATRPKEIKVHLLKDGTIHDTVVLNSVNNWRYVWSDLDADAVWTVAEAVPEGYTVSITQDGIAFILTNSKPPETPEPPPDLPQTGQLWWPVPVLAVSGMILFLIGYIRNRGAYEE